MRYVLLSLSLFASSAFAEIPILYQQAAMRHGVDANALYSLALQNTGRLNQAHEFAPWPWTVSVNGNRYQFKSRIDLFNYLVEQRGKAAITFGIDNQPLKIESREQLWAALDVPEMVNRAAQQLVKSQPRKSQPTPMLAKSRTTVGKNGIITVIAEPNAQYQFATTSKPVINPQYIGLVNQVSKEVGIDPLLIHAVMAQESAGQQKATSRKGAMGLMQLMPATASALGLSPNQYYDPYYNVRGGAIYLKQQLDRFGSLPLALAAYNAGPNAVIRYGNKIPPYRETRQYVAKITQKYNVLRGVMK